MPNPIYKVCITAILLLALIFSSSENIRAELIDNDIEFKNITYIVDKKNRTVTVEGEGAFSCSHDPLSSDEEYYHLKLTHWTIGEGITKIKDMMDWSVMYMESIHLPKSLQIIDEYAFYFGIRLKSIVIPNGVKMIHKNAFESCHRLEKVTNLSDQTVYLPNHPSFGIRRGTIYDYYVDGKEAVTVPPGKTAIGKARKYIVALESHGGTIKGNPGRDIYFRSGEPLKLPGAKKKGYIFCGWTARLNSNIAWFTITGKDTDESYGSTFFWGGYEKPICVYAQYANIKSKKLGKRKLNLKLSELRKTYQLKIQYSTNKKFKKAKSITVKNNLQILKKKINKKQHYLLKFSRKKKTLSVTLSKLKAGKKYYFRFQYQGYFPSATEELDVMRFGDWFKKTVKM